MKRLLAAVLLVPAATLAAPPRPDFTLTLPAPGARVMEVTARFVVDKPALSVADWGAEHLPAGWGTFIEDVALADGEGRPVALTGGPTAWKMGAGPGTPVTLTYRLKLEHDRHAWPHGLDEAAFVKPDAVFATGMAMFLSPDDTAGATVRFALPPGWRASTPWKALGDNRFAVSSGDELLSNVVMLGTHQETVFTQDGMRVTLAAGGRMAASAPAVERVMRASIAAYSRMYGGVPKPAYLVTLHDGATDGGAFAGSYAMLASEPLAAETLIDWGHIVAHETMHLWNGTGMAPRTRMDWLTEGFTDYLTLLTLRREGLIDESLFSKKMESHARRAQPGDAARPSLADAGKDKKANWNWIYGGGAMLGLVLDQEIRAASGGKASLETAMRALFARFNGARYTLDEVVAAMSAAAGKDLSGLIARHVTGKAPLPMKEAFAGMGYRMVTNLQGEVFLVGAADGEALRTAWRGR